MKKNEKKRKLRHTKMRLHEQTQNMKLEKKIKQQISLKTYVNSKLSSRESEILVIKNEYNKYDKELLLLKNKVNDTKEILKIDKKTISILVAKIKKNKMILKKESELIKNWKQSEKSSLKNKIKASTELKNKVKNEEKKLFELTNKVKNNEQSLKTNKTKIASLVIIVKEHKTILKNESKLIQKLNQKPKGKLLLKNKENDIITIENLNKFYISGKIFVRALTNINLSIKTGTFNVILGPSGSGKTTLLNMLSGLDRPTTGNIIFDGKNIAALSQKQLTQFRRNQIGFIFQSYNLLPSLDVNDNIEVGRSLQSNRQKRRDIKELLVEMDMPHSRNKKTYELSGGQQQRVSIARALAKSPSLLIGDEPTGALDQTTSLKVFELFQRINGEQKATIIIVTHNINVAKLAHQVIHVKNGAIDKIVINEKPLLAKNMKEI